MASIHFKTLGCKVNNHDTQTFATKFRLLGYDIVDSATAADIIVINTCTVTASADREARYLVRRFRRENPTALLVATGCYAQTNSQELTTLDGLDLIVPNQIKEELVALVNERYKNADNRNNTSKMAANITPVANNQQDHFESKMRLSEADSDQTRAYLKIQDGCNSFCSYCIIPFARGKSRSVATGEVKAELRRLIDKGIKEIVLTGIHVGNYGRDLAEFAGVGEPIVNFLQQILKWPDMVRLRLSSIEPNELSQPLLQVLAERKDIFCDHFHLALQSGCDRILHLMGRPYTTRQFRERLSLVQSYFPTAFIGTDIIVGFPGETDEDFADTYSYLNELGLSALHVFAYSRRPNTRAASLAGQVDAALIKSRAATLRELSVSFTALYLQSCVGRTTAVLWENSLDNSAMRIGRSLNYLEVLAPDDYFPEPGTIDQVRLIGIRSDGRAISQLV